MVVIYEPLCPEPQEGRLSYYLYHSRAVPRKYLLSEGMVKGRNISIPNKWAKARTVIGWR